MELVDSVDDPHGLYEDFKFQFLKCSITKIVPPVNRIIHNSHLKRTISLEEQKGPEAGPFLSRKTDCLLDLRILPGHWGQ